jgi:uncharacterized protein involved in exopolysaccharide biosynthesis
VLQRALELGAERLPSKIKSDPASAAQEYEELLRRVSVENELNSDILSVRVTQTDPEVAAELANDIGLSYAEYVKTLARGGGADELRALETEIADSRATLTSMDRQIADLKAKSRIFDVMQSGEAESATKSATDERMAQVEGQYRGQIAALADAEQQLRVIPRSISSGHRNAISPVVYNLQETLAAERTNLADLRSQYYDDFPLVKRQTQRVRDLEKQLRSTQAEVEAENYTGVNPVYQAQWETVESLRSQVRSLERQVEALRAASEKSSTVLAGIPAAERKLQALIRQRTVAEQNFEQIEQRRAIVQAIGMARQPSARIVSTALPPTRPSFPDSRLLTMGGFALGAFFAILILMPRPSGPYAGDGLGVLPSQSAASRLGASPGRDLSRPDVPGDET